MDKKNYKNMWVHIEHNNGEVHAVSLELCCEMRKICDLSGDKLIAVIAGNVPKSEIEKIKECGVDGFIMVSGTGYERYNTEAYTNLYTVLCEKYKPSAVMVGGTTNGRDFAPRFAVRLNTGCTSDATELIYNPDTTDIEFVEPAAGGKIMAVITIPVNASKDDVLAIVKADSRVVAAIDGKTVVKEIVVPGKIINIVVK